LLPLFSCNLLLLMTFWLLRLLLMSFGMLLQALTPSKFASTYTAYELAMVCMYE
jgi:hypothetical protein